METFIVYLIRMCGGASFGGPQSRPLPAALHARRGLDSTIVLPLENSQGNPPSGQARISTC